jgi:hypothetical protein
MAKCISFGAVHVESTKIQCPRCKIVRTIEDAKKTECPGEKGLESQKSAAAMQIDWGGTTSPLW